MEVGLSSFLWGWRLLCGPTPLPPSTFQFAGHLHTLSWHLFFFFFFESYFLNFISVLAVLGLHCCAPASSSCGEQGLRFVMVHTFPLVWLLLLQSRGSMERAQEFWCVGLAAPRYVGSSWSRDRTRIPFTGRWILNHRSTRESL